MYGIYYILARLAVPDHRYHCKCVISVPYSPTVYRTRHQNEVSQTKHLGLDYRERAYSLV